MFAMFIAAILMIAQPFGIRMAAVGPGGETVTVTSTSRFPDRASCETARQAEKARLAAGGYFFFDPAGKLFLALGSECVVVNGQPA